MGQVYHHSTTASIAWVAFWGEVSSGYIGLLSNCFVHIVMYLYFALVAMDRDLRKYGHWVTKLQLVQFWLVFLCSMYWLVFYGESVCPLRNIERIPIRV
jgi:elongation of very long chain fatty acids protein 4